MLSFIKKVAIKKWRKKSGDKKAAIKSADKKAPIKNDGRISKKLQEQCKCILTSMEQGREYRLTEFCELLGLRESRTKSILRFLAAEQKIEILGGNRDRRYRLKV